MDLEKTTEEDKFEVVCPYKLVQVRTATIIKEDDLELTRAFSRRVIECVLSSHDGSSWTHTDTDMSSVYSELQGLATAVWTTEIKEAKKIANESTGI